MPKKKIEGLDEPLEELDLSWDGESGAPLEKKVEETIPAPEEFKSFSKGKIKATVQSIYKGKLFLKDEKGSGYIIPITKENKDVKIGDSILL
jgi:hypothetical protein